MKTHFQFCIYDSILRLFQAAYYRISYKLRYRFQAGFVSTEDNLQKNRRQLRGRKLQRTNLLLGSIAIIFCISWLPLNLFNLIADLSDPQFVSQPMMVSLRNFTVFRLFRFYFKHYKRWSKEDFID